MNVMRGRRAFWLPMFAVMLLVMPGTARVSSAAGNLQAAATPEQAVATLLEPFYNPAAGTGACDAVSGQFAACPITARLRDRLEHATENGNIVSRSQNPPRSVTINPIHNDGQMAHAATIWDYGNSSYSITFTVVKQDDGWLVDDSFCTALPTSSIYNAPTGPCPLDTRGEALPGMPTTGATLFLPFALLTILAALLALIAGLLARAVAGRREGH